MKVYLIYNWLDEYVDSVWSTYELALKKANRKNNDDTNDFEIVIKEVDPVQ